MRYSIASNLRIYQRIGKKYVFHWEKLNFEHIGNFLYTVELLAWEGSSEYLYQLFNVLPKQTTSEMKALQV